ncbi:tail fiber/spike domain-containing protein [Hafnia alvei]|uniref:tail fiber/spike domain-containing protein n=1 Tax=Hafnia alvei TaxID=569 RepID=UPI004043A046
MATQPTQDAVPSESPRDLKFNAGKIDEFVTSSGWTYTDRFGNKHYTIEGINYLAQQVMNSFGYVTLTGVSFTTGATITKPNEVLFNEANNEYYKWTGSFSSGSKIVPANSTPESTGGVGAGKWLSVGDSTLRGELAESTGSEMVGHGEKTVDEALTELEKTQGKDGFNAIGRFLNLTELRAFPPKAVGDVVYVVSAASTSVEDIHYGGGYFQAVRKQSLVDDGGVTIVPSSGILTWRRIIAGEFYSIDMFGAKPDGATESGDQILKAMTFARANKVVMNASAGKYLTHTGIPIWKKSGLKGGGIGVTTIAKTTNDKYHVTTGKDIDAFVLFLGDNMDVDDYTADCENATLTGFTFIREGLTGRENNTEYGLWMPKLNVSIIDNLRLECPYIGIWGEDVWFNKIHAQIVGLGVKQFYGVYIGKIRNGSYLLSGTSNDLMIGVTNYQIGHFYAGQQYTTMTCCTCDNCEPMTDLGETSAIAYQFINPVGITMNSCGSEGVSGARLTVSMTDDSLYDCTLVVNAYQGMIEQRNPSVSTPIYRIQSSHTTKNLSVIFNACNLKKDVALTNQTVGFVGGANTYLNNIGSVLDAPTVSGGAVFKSL